MTVLHIAFVLFIIVAGFAKGDVRNLTIAAASAGRVGGGAAATDSAVSGGGFAPFGMRGIFNGAAIVYFSYIGYDAVSTTAEEVKNPAKNMTIGLSGSVIAVTILYCFIALALCMLQPYNLVRRRKILRAKLLLVLCILESSSFSLSAAHHLCLFVCLSERGKKREMRPGLIKLSFFL
jgi:amino acid transporter